MWSWPATHRSIAMAMKSQVNCVCLALIATVATVLAAPDNCSSQYQTALQQVVDLKKGCPEAVIKDCCEVRDSTQAHSYPK